MSRRDRIAKRLREWIHELNTNKHGMQHLAYRAITVLQRQLPPPAAGDGDKR